MTQKTQNKKVIQSMLHDVILSAALEVRALPITKYALVSHLQCLYTVQAICCLLIQATKTRGILQQNDLDIRSEIEEVND